MNKQQIEIAVGAGLELLGEKSELSIPVKLNDGVFLLKQFLLGIANGQLGIAPAMQKEDDVPPKTPPQSPPPNRNQRRTAKKAGKKAASKKK